MTQHDDVPAQRAGLYDVIYALGSVNLTQEANERQARRITDALVAQGFVVAPAERAEDSEIVRSAEFLIDRLYDFEREIGEGEEYREYAGHVAPAVARLISALGNRQSPAASENPQAICFWPKCDCCMSTSASRSSQPGNVVYAAGGDGTFDESDEQPQQPETINIGGSMITREQLEEAIKVWKEVRGC